MCKGVGVRVVYGGRVSVPPTIGLESALRGSTEYGETQSGVRGVGESWLSGL